MPQSCYRPGLCHSRLCLMKAMLAACLPSTIHHPPYLLLLLYTSITKHVWNGCMVERPLPRTKYRKKSSDKNKTCNTSKSNMRDLYTLARKKPEIKPITQAIQLTYSLYKYFTCRTTATDELLARRAEAMVIHSIILLLLILVLKPEIMRLACCSLLHSSRAPGESASYVNRLLPLCYRGYLNFSRLLTYRAR